MPQFQIKSVENIGTIIKNRRRELSITQKELAQFCQLSHTGISKIETGQANVQIDTLLKLSKFLGFKIKIEMEVE